MVACTFFYMCGRGSGQGWRMAGAIACCISISIHSLICLLEDWSQGWEVRVGEMPELHSILGSCLRNMAYHSYIAGHVTLEMQVSVIYKLETNILALPPIELLLRTKWVEIGLSEDSLGTFNPVKIKRLLLCTAQEITGPWENPQCVVLKKLLSLQERKTGQEEHLWEITTWGKANGAFCFVFGDHNFLTVILTVYPSSPWVVLTWEEVGSWSVNKARGIVKMYLM